MFSSQSGGNSHQRLTLFCVGLFLFLNMALPHIGSWGLPDFGVTEWLSGTNRNNQGGSTLNSPTTQEFLPQNFQSAEQIKYGPTPPGRNLNTTTTSNTINSAGTGGRTATLGMMDQNLNQTPQDPYAGLRNDISSGWDSFIGSLDQQLEGLSGQRTSQEGIAQSQFNQGVNTLDLNRSEADQNLARETDRTTQNQSRTLKDLADNIRNSFQAGNVYLGSRGAGDSSAANQYAYALTKLGTKQRTDIQNNTANILSDIQGRADNVRKVYDTTKANLQEGLNQQIQGIAQWFANAQQAIQQQKAQGQLSKSQDLTSLSRDILNQGLAQIQRVQQQVQDRQNALDSWAMSNSENLTQLRANLQEVSNPQYQLPQAQSVVGTPQITASGGIYAPTGYSSNDPNQRQLSQFSYPFATNA